jgi:hypothetical protein
MKALAFSILWFLIATITGTFIVAALAHSANLAARGFGFQ